MNQPITFRSSFSGLGLDWEGAGFGNSTSVNFKKVIYRWNEYGSIFPRTSEWTAGVFYNCMLSSSAGFTWPREAKDDEARNFPFLKITFYATNKSQPTLTLCVFSFSHEIFNCFHFRVHPKWRRRGLFPGLRIRYVSLVKLWASESRNPPRASVLYLWVLGSWTIHGIPVLPEVTLKHFT